MPVERLMISDFYSGDSGDKVCTTIANASGIHCRTTHGN